MFMQTRKISWQTVCGFVAIIMMVATYHNARAATWDGGGDGIDWHDGGNWDPVGIPGNGAAVVIGDGATVLLTNNTADLTSFTMTGGTLTFSNWTTRLRATEVVVTNDATLTLPPPFKDDAMSNRVWIVCSNFTLHADAVIDANGKGFARLNGPGKGAGANTHSSGAGYGGRGGRGNYNYAPGLPYGSVEAPTDPGSGGGHRGGNPSGGGAIRIQADGAVTVHGIITANGAISSEYRDGGGSGGSIYITCDTFSGEATGLLSVKGGRHNSSSRAGGGGGGGRIAVDYQQLGHPAAVRMTAARSDRCWGVAALDLREPFAATDGTIWLPDAQLLTAPTMSGIFYRGVLIIPGFDSWSVDSLTVTNTAFRIGNPDFQLIVTHDLTVADAEFGVGTTKGLSSVFVGGDIILEYGGILDVFSGTNQVDGYGARLSVTGDIAIAGNAWLRPYAHPMTNGTVRIEAENLTVTAGGGINANNRGYYSQYGPGTGRDGWHDCGASYGGLGAYGTYGRVPREVYGVISAPDEAGSGGGGGAGTGRRGGGAGGGLIRLALRGNATVDGTLAANAGDYITDGAGGGAGGAILLQCQNFGGAASGLLTARGGNNTGGRGGAGGGGRIAVDYQALVPGTAVRFNTEPGNSQYAFPRRKAHPGTLWLSTPEMLLAETIEGNRFMGVRFHAPGFDSWTVNNLTISNSAVIFGEDGFALNVTGDLIIGVNGLLGIGAISGDERPSLNCGRLTVLGGGELHIFAGRTNGVDAGIGATIDVTDELTVVSDGWIYPHAHALDDGGGGAPVFRAHSLQIEPQGGFRANGLGYRVRHGPGVGASAASRRGGGGGHGGAGGDHSYTVGSGGKTNGLALAAINPGSGGGFEAGGGDGGGVIRLEVATVLEIDGVLDARGLNSIGGGGGGAGGSVLLSANGFRISNTAEFLANGGNGHKTEAGGGGGGRITFWRKVPINEQKILFDGQIVNRLLDRITDETKPLSGVEADIEVNGGTGFDAGDSGTVRFINGVYSGTLIIIQ